MSHLILDIYTHTRYTATELLHLMKRICNHYRFNVLNEFSHQFVPDGETAILALQESHFSIHTYPEKSQVAVDLYTCKKHDWKRLQAIRDDLLREFNGSSKCDVILERP